MGQPDDTEFVTDISKLKAILDSLSGSVSLLLEMRESREHAFALYQEFSIPYESSYYYIRVNEYDPGSTAGNSLVLTPDIVSGCVPIFYKTYYAHRCHNASPFGRYDNNDRNDGITWPSWLGTAISMDFIEFKFREWHCSLSVGSKCHLCDANYALTIDPVSGREYCRRNAVTSTCFLDKIKNFGLNNCIEAEDCKTNAGQYISDQACLSCHTSCPGGCKGPDREDCLFGTCREYHEFFPEHSTTSHLAILLINGEQKPTWCEPEGWTVILNNQDNDDVSSLTFNNFVADGINFLPRMFMMPLNNIAAITSQKNYELRVQLAHTDGSSSHDVYGYFTLITNQFKFNAYFKKDSSPNLASFDIGQLLNGVSFQAINSSANPTSCFTDHSAGSWYSPTCEGFALLGSSASMFYGSLNQIASSKLLIRETACLQWENGPTSYRCSLC